MLKRWVLFIVALTGTMIFFGNRNGWAQEIGRYQLFQGSYSHLDADSGATSDKKEVFLLDTATGDVQVYVSTSTEGKQVKYWSPAVVDETKKSFTI